ncbi:MAG: exosome complex exonuclease Rrp41 [Candidatus Aenigmarchaeota archaeon]|nr:exosome complex exonuclease Rrp41 [Candidatus Aenigmarchaeota archaeon]
MAKDLNKELIIDGLRMDGRLTDQLRDVKMEIGTVSSASGSAYVSFGHTTAIASVQGPRSLFPKFLQNSQTGILRVRYNMLPFSVSDRKSPGPDRRSTELSKVIRKSLEPAVILDDFPKATIDGFIEMIEADGSTRVTGINALSLALAHAGIPMKDLVAACSVGKINNTLILDLNGLEDNNSESDVAVAMMPNKNLITLLQMDGMLTKEEFMKLLNTAKDACGKIYEMQKMALLEKYKGEEQ